MPEPFVLRLNKPFALQDEIRYHPARYKVLAIGRQWGKSELALIDTIERMLRHERIWYCSPTNANNKRMYPKVKRALRDFPGIKTNDTDMRVELPSGGMVQFVSLHEPDNLRGEGLHHIKIDEAAFVRDGVYDTVLKPMIGVTRGSVWFMSSPNGKNWFFNYAMRGHDPEYKDWHTWHMASHTSPLWNRDELHEVERDTPRRVWLQEYLAEFLTDGGAVFRNVNNCIVTQPEHSGSVVFGVDLGRKDDATVIVALDTKTRHVLEIDRFTDTAWDLQINRLIAMAERHKPQSIWIEENFNTQFVEDVFNAGYPVEAFRASNTNNAIAVNQLALALERGHIGIPDDPVLLGELQAFSVRRLPGGSLKYEAPSGLHDDMVDALAIALYGADNTIDIGDFQLYGI